MCVTRSGTFVVSGWHRFGAAAGLIYRWLSKELEAEVTGEPSAG